MENKLLALAVVIAAAVLLACWRRDYRIRHTSQSPTPLVAAGLEKRIGPVRLEGVTLWEALCRLEQITGTRMRWIDSGNSAAITGQPPLMSGANWGVKVQLDARDISLAAALDLLMGQASGAFAGPATFDVDADGTILLGCDADMPRVVRVYGVADLADRIEPPQEEAVGFTSQLTAPRPLPERVAALVEDALATESWKDNGGTSASWRSFGGKLIIVQTRRNHRQIELLFEQLRRLHARIGDAPTFGGPL